MTLLRDNESTTDYNEKEAPIGKCLSKMELLDRLEVIESALKKILNVQQCKSIAKNKVLVEELKRRVEISPENIHYIPLDLPCPTPICASYNHVSCVSLQPEEVVNLENRLNAALMHLSATEEDDDSEVMSSESTIDTISDSGTEEDKSTVLHNNEVIFIGKNQVTSKTKYSSDIFTSTKESTPLSDREFPTNKVKKSSGKYKGILLNSMGNGNVKRTDNSRNVRTVRFCNQCSVHHIVAEPTSEDRLARARRLIKEARNSRQTLAGAIV